MRTGYKCFLIIFCVSYAWTVQGEFSKQHKPDLAEETQHAMCNISTKGIQSSANASVTRQIRGVCTSKQLDIRFRQLELKIIKELEIIKQALSREKNIEPSILKNVPTSSSYYESYSDDAQLKDYQNIDEIKPIFSSFRSTSFDHSQRITPNEVSPILILDEQSTEKTEKRDEVIMDNSFSSFPWNVSDDKHIINEDLIRELNNTVQGTRNGKVFYYFWKIENFNILMSKSEMYVRSPTLLVQGHELMIQFHPNQPRQNHLTIKLKTSYSFQKKHKFSILQRQGLRKNIESRLLGSLNEINQFVVPLKLIHSTGCLLNDSIVVSITIFLEMN